MERKEMIGVTNWQSEKDFIVTRKRLKEVNKDPVREPYKRNSYQTTGFAIT
jgi:hypothetical protein